MRALLNRAYNSLEWALNSPPKPHPFVNLPLQSSLGGLASLSPVKLNPNFVTGFCDGEASFSLNLFKQAKSKFGYTGTCLFAISLHKKDLALLEAIRAYFNGIGNLFVERENSVKFAVNSREDLQVIIDHFERYPLITQKRADYLLFKQALELMNNKEHYELEGLKQLFGIKAAMN